jgi:hypothetical protein
VKIRTLSLMLLLALVLALAATGCGTTVQVNVVPPDEGDAQSEGSDAAPAETAPEAVEESSAESASEPAAPETTAPEGGAPEGETEPEPTPAPVESEGAEEAPPEGEPASTSEEPTEPETSEPVAGGDSCAAYEGEAYTVTWNSEQVNALLDGALLASERGYVGTRGVTLENDQIAAQVEYKVPGGTVKGDLVLGIGASNGDLVVTVVHAQIGQIGMTEARKAAINRAVELAIKAQLRDFRCIDSATARGGVLTIVYH